MLSCFDLSRALFLWTFGAGAGELNFGGGGSMTLGGGGGMVLGGGGGIPLTVELANFLGAGTVDRFLSFESCFGSPGFRNVAPCNKF